MSNQSGCQVIVTGGAGFIGSALVWALNARGIDDILIVDRLDTSEKWKNLVPLDFTDFVDADVFDNVISGDPAAFPSVRTVYHLGACSSTSETDAAYLLRNNYEYTKRLATWAVARGIRFVYASSAATYGGLEDGLREDAPLSSLRPLNMYAYSKHLFDRYAERNGLSGRITAVKYFNVFGPNEQHKGDMRSMVNKAFYQIRETGRVRLFKSDRPEYGHGEQRRDFVYVKDAVDMTIHLAEGEHYGIYNVGSGEAHTWLDLIRPIFAALECEEQIEFIDMPPALRGKYQYCTKAEMTRLYGTGYRGEMTPLPDAVHDYVVNYLIPDARLDVSSVLVRN